MNKILVIKRSVLPIQAVQLNRNTTHHPTKINLIKIKKGMRDDNQFIENGLEAPVYKEEMGGMSVYITRKKGLYGEDDGVNDTVNDTVKVIDNKNITTDNDHINDHINDHVNDHIKLSANEKKVLQLMWNDMAINYEQIEKKLKISTSTTMRAIKKLRKEMLVVREGSKKSGYWYVTEKGKELL